MTKDIIPADSKAVELGKAKGVEVIEDNDKPSRDDLLVRNIFIYPDVREAGIKAGYSESYVNCGQYYNRLKKPSFQAKLVEYAKAHNILSLPNILQVEDEAIQYLVDLAKAYSQSKDPKAGRDLLGALAKTKHTLTQRKQIAGLLRPEDEGRTPHLTVNIQDVQNMMVKGG